MLRPVVVCLVLVVVAGCAHQPAAPGASQERSARSARAAPGPSDGRFPGRDTLTELAEAPPPAAAPRPAYEVSVPSWEAQGPFPREWAFTPHHDPSSPFQSAVVAVAARRGGTVVASEAAHCMARELGRFHLAHKGLPTEDLVGWLARACTLSLEPQVSWTAVEVADSVPEPQVVEALKKGFEEGLESMVSAGSDIGIWYGRGHGRAVVMRVAAPRKAVFGTGSVAPAPDGTITIQGELLTPGDQAGAVATKGPDGYDVCVPAEGVRLPKFRFTCHLDVRDPWALVDVGVTPAGRMLALAVGRLMARPVDPAALRWTAGGTGKDAESGDVVRRETLGLINDRRTRAGLRALTDVRAQSRQVTALAPYYFAAGTRDDAPETWADTATLGALAGYELLVNVEDAWPGAASSRSRDPAALFAALFQTPNGRRMLMEPAATHVAIGPLLAEHANGLFVVTYDELKAEEETANAAALVARWEKARQASGRAPLRRLDAAQPALAAVARAIADGEEPQTAMKKGLDAAASALEANVQGGLVTAGALSLVELPEVLAGLEKGGFAVAVEWSRYADVAWGQYVVAYLVVSQ